MKMTCLKCKLTARNSLHNLVEKGWGGTKAVIDGFGYSFELCPDHYSAKQMAEIIRRLREFCVRFADYKQTYEAYFAYPKQKARTFSSRQFLSKSKRRNQKKEM